MKSEFERLRETTFVDTPNCPIVVISARASDPNESLDRVREVLGHFAEQRGKNGPWPTDDEWTQRLPSWFTAPFDRRTIPEVLANQDLWDYGSWLDTMRNRGWEWWSSSCDPDEGSWTAVLIQQEMVYSIEPLVYLARESGASTIKVTEE